MRPPVVAIVKMEGGAGRLAGIVLQPTPMKALRAASFRVMTSSYGASYLVGTSLNRFIWRTWLQRKGNDHIGKTDERGQRGERNE